MDWSLRNFPKIEHGIFFGYGESDRLRMWMGIMKPRDWRQDKHVVRTDPMSVSGYERRALASGVPAVVNAHQIYGVSTFLERQKIVQEYQAWRDEQMIPAVVSEAESRAAMMAKRAKSVAEKPRARRLSPEDRPQCPNGHGGVPMHRVQKTGAFQRWSCYKCMAKVLVDEAIGDRLNG